VRVRAPDPLVLMVVGQSALAAAVDLDVRGVQIDGDLHAQRRSRSGGSAANIAAWISPIPVSTAAHSPIGQPQRQPARVLATNPGTGASTCPAASAHCRFSRDLEVLPGQLRRGHPD
jgi:hypothetical protein